MARSLGTGLVANLRLRFGNAVRRLRRPSPSPSPSPSLVANVYETPNGTFAIASSDSVIGSVLHQGRSWGAEEVDRILAVATPDSDVLFVGGHVGTLAIPVARKVRSVTIVEANPRNFRFLSANLQLNAVENARLFPLAAGEKAGTIEFLASKHNTGGSKRKPLVADERYYYDSPDLISVPMARLDDVIQERFSIIVMDIEGSEYFALKGMPRLLEAADCLFVEFLPHHLDNVSGVSVEAFLDAIGPSYRFLYNPSDGETVSGDAILAKAKALYAAGVGEDVLVFSKRSLAGRIG